MNAANTKEDCRRVGEPASVPFVLGCHCSSNTIHVIAKLEERDDVSVKNIYKREANNLLL